MRGARPTPSGPGERRRCASERLMRGAPPCVRWTAETPTSGRIHLDQANGDVAPRKRASAKARRATRRGCQSDGGIAPPFTLAAESIVPGQPPVVVSCLRSVTSRYRDRRLMLPLVEDKAAAALEEWRFRGGRQDHLISLPERGGAGQRSGRLGDEGVGLVIQIQAWTWSAGLRELREDLG